MFEPWKPERSDTPLTATEVMFREATERGMKRQAERLDLLKRTLSWLSVWEHQHGLPAPVQALREEIQKHVDGTNV